MNPWIGLLWLLVLLIVNAFFVAAEFALVAARRSQIEPLAAQGRKSAQVALWALEHAGLMLATCQLGITVASLLILNVAEPSIHDLIVEGFGFTGLSHELLGGIGFVVALIVVTFLHVTFGEMVPKNVSFSVPDRAVLILAAPLVFIGRIVRPLIWLLNVIANGFVRMCGLTPRQEAVSTFTLEQVATIVSHSQAEGTLEGASNTLSAAFEFTAKKAKDSLVPLAALVSLAEPVTVEDLEQAVTKHGFSRFPVLNASGNLSGYVHLKDVLDGEDASGTGLGAIKSKRIRHIESMHAETDLEDALAAFQRSGAHLARVFDDAGETLGVLFLEDIIEELVGEVNDATRRR